jgi:hypothetical protein
MFCHPHANWNIGSGTKYQIVLKNMFNFSWVYGITT